MRRNEHPENVKAAVRRTGISLAELARRKGLSTSTTRKALRRPTPSGNRAIAEHLGKSLHQLWPEWFDADGNRISSVKDSRPRRGGASQKRADPLALRRASA